MCEVCKTDQKCAHPWAQCMASRGEHCAACGHTSWAPRRPPTLRHRPPVQKSPKGQPQEGGPSPSGDGRVWRLLNPGGPRNRPTPPGPSREQTTMRRD